MQGHQRKFGQSPSQDNLQMLAGYNNISNNLNSGQVYFQNQNSAGGNNMLLQQQISAPPQQRMQTPPPPNTQNKMATTIQGTGGKIINNQFTGGQVKLPNSMVGNTLVSMSSNVSQISTASNTNSSLSIKNGIDVNRKLKGENEAISERIKDLEKRGKEQQFNYAKEHIDVASFIMNNYSKYCGLLNELNEGKLQYLEETRKNRQVRDINDQLKQKQRNNPASNLNPQELQEQNRQFDLKRQIEQMQKDNQALATQYRQAENEILVQSDTRNPQEKGFASKQEEDNLKAKLAQLSENVHKLTEKLEEQEKRKHDYNLNSGKKNFFAEYDQMSRQVASLRKSNQDLNENLKAKIIEIHKLQGKEPPNFQQDLFSKQFQK